MAFDPIMSNPKSLQSAYRNDTSEQNQGLTKAGSTGQPDDGSSRYEYRA